MVETGYVFRVERGDKWGPVDILHLTEEELDKILEEKSVDFLRNMVRGLRCWINEHVDEDLSALITTKEQFVGVLRGEGMKQLGIDILWNSRPSEPLNRGKLIASAKHAKKIHPDHFDE